MSGAWAAFARTGSPSHAGIPNWPAYTLDRRETMIFDLPATVLRDPVSRQRRVWADLA